MTFRRIVQTTRQQNVGQSTSGRTTDVAALHTLDRLRRVVRSEDLVRAVQSLDTATDPQMLKAIMDWITEEYENRQGGLLVGLFGKCYLGEPYVDHRFDFGGSMILEHFKRSEEPPPAFRPARPFARSDAYAYIEVYDDGTVIPIRADGRPVL
jgi:hypothetical protein